MLKRLIFVGLTVVAPLAVPAAPDAGQPAATEGTTWAVLKAPVPGTPASCPDQAPAGSGLVKVSLFSEKTGGCTVAKVGDDSIVLDELVRALAATHGSHGAAAKAGKQDALIILNRLVDVRLIVQEARAMGIDEEPEVVKGIRSIEERVGRDMLKERVLRDVKAAPADVTRFFQDASRQWKLQSVLFLRESEAKAMSKALKGGKSFDALATRAVADKKATGNSPGEFVDPGKLLPAVVAALQKTPVGKATAPIKVPGGWTIVEVEAVRYPEDARLRAEAEQKALLEARKKALKAYYDGLVKKYAKVDEKLLAKIDFEAKTPGFEAMKKDTRVVARIEGKPSITVGDLTSRMEEQFYHGVEAATQKQKLNKSKGTTLDAMLSGPVVAVEVERLGISRTDEYRQRVDADVDGLLFGTFVQKVVAPSVKVTVGDVRKYYEAHKADYTQAAFYKVESLGFARQKDAEAAVAKLRSGTDFKWLNANAEGKLEPGKDTERPPSVVSAKGLSPAFAAAVDGAKKGDYRVFVPAPDQAYALYVVDIVPPTIQPLEEVQGPVGDKVYGDALQKAVDDWLGKLRKARPVQVYLTRITS